MLYILIIFKNIFFKINNLIINKDIIQEKNKNNKEDLYSKENNINYPINEIENSGREIRVKKNNKMIFMNKSLIKQKTKKKDIMIEKKRKSRYRGVSKNGNKWQVIIFSKNNNGYIGVYKNEEIAARNNFININIIFYFY